MEGQKPSGINNSQESAEAHVRQLQNEAQLPRNPEEPQKRKRKSTVPYRRKNSATAYFDRMLTADLTRGLTEEQIRISNECGDEIASMALAGATPEEIRKVRDEYRLRQYPGLSLEEAEKKEQERLRKIYED
jgi:hypothetical protein